ncbi:alpha/beta hydrolase fold domain-containing protein [Parvibaculum sedimenti]|uniref:Alpha/beta hydrolase fold domain-containing protein n=1 Tax=Parvibaculum sedimenti TaxID=2608632 RepID=A0A6N6VFL7_9HYPH|nr:alpha/beta hydrolase [Parvibaculum sedimenti]KAB7739007.1 alpha/beta hydrolase fold domain-containing protein [Parvibaculum sedimenti]
MRSCALWILSLIVALFISAPASAGLFNKRMDIPAGTKVERDIPYGRYKDQRLDVFMPAGVKGAPIILMVHGGAWAVGDKEMDRVVENKVAHWVPRGVIFVSVNYRMIPDADPVTQADDVARALAFVQNNAASWGGDPARVVLMGHSAGAHLVMLLTADTRIAAAQGAKPWLGTVSLDSGAMNVPEIMNAKHYRFYDRAFGDDPAYWEKASPYQRLMGRPKPIFIVCSTKREDSCPQGRAFAEKARAMGGRVGVLPVALTHREVNEELGLPSGYTNAVDDFLRMLGLP